MSPGSNRVEAASAGQWTVLFFSVTKKILKKEKKSYKSPDHIKKYNKKNNHHLISLPVSLPPLPSIETVIFVLKRDLNDCKALC